MVEPIEIGSVTTEAEAEEFRRRGVTLFGIPEAVEADPRFRRIRGGVGSGSVRERGLREEAKRRAQEEARRQLEIRAQQLAEQRRLAEQRAKAKAESLRLSGEKIRLRERQIALLRERGFSETKARREVTKFFREFEEQRLPSRDQKKALKLIEKFPDARPVKGGLIVPRPGGGTMFIPFVKKPDIKRGTVEEQPEKVVEPLFIEPPKEKKPEIKLDFVEEVEVPRRETEIGKIPPIPSDAFISRLSTITPVKRKEGLIPSAAQLASKQRALLQAEESRRGVSVKSTALGLGIGALASVVKTGEFGVSLITEPTETVEKVVLGIPRIPEQLGKLGAVIRREPAFVTGFVAGEIIQAKAIGKAVRKTGELAQRIRTEVSPTFRPLRVERGKQFFEVPSDVPDEALRIKIAPPLKRLKEPIAKQIRLSGKEVEAVSAQTLKRALGKEGFEFGKLKRELFFDPRGRLRVSRLGLGELQKEAKLLDVLSGDVTFRAGKRAALIFEKAPVEKLPFSLRDIDISLRRGRGLTPSQARRLKLFQDIPTGKFKPIGFLSTEPEVTLPAGEIIKFERGLGATIIKGKRVELIRPSIVTPTKQAKQILKVSTISAKDVSKLSSISTKDISKISSVFETRPFVSPTRISVSAGVSLGKLTRGISRPSRVSRVSPLLTSDFSIPKIPISGISRRPSPRRRARVSKILRPSRRRQILDISSISSLPRIERMITPPVPTPFTPLPFVRRMKKKKEERRKRSIREDIRITEGFLAKTLGFKPVRVTPKEVRRLASLPARAIGIRRAPLLIPDVPRRMRK